MIKHRTDSPIILKERDGNKIGLYLLHIKSIKKITYNQKLKSRVRMHKTI